MVTTNGTPTSLVEPRVTLPASRSRAASRALLWSAPTALLGATTALIYGRLNFVPSGISNRFVDYSLAVAASPIPLAAVLSLIKALRWWLLCLWPTPVGVFADRSHLQFQLGPFGSRRYDTARMEVRYPFELAGEAEAGSFEAFLPEEQQFATLLPRITHPDAPEPLNRVILRFAAASEADAASALRPVLELWRSHAGERGAP